MSRFTIIVTGGLGNIGSYVVDKLVRKDCRVVIIDNFYNSSYEKYEEALRRLPVFTDRRDLVLEEVDISNYDDVLRVYRKHSPNATFHLASMLTLDSKLYRRQSILTNVVGTQNVIEAHLAAEAVPFIAASSASVFGDPDDIPTNELHHFKNNKLLYGAGKIADEVMYASYAEEFERFKFSAMRFFNVYGPRASINNVYTQIIQKWIRAINAGEPITIYGDGSQTMDFVHADDAAESMLLSFEKRVYRNVKHQFDGFFNIGSGTSTSVNELKELLFRIMNKRVEVCYQEHDPNLVKKRQCDATLARTLLGWEPKVTLEEGLKQCIQVYQ